MKFFELLIGNIHINFQVEFIVRMVLAIICGGSIGFERKNRGKEAGIRTHSIVAMSSALIMIVSKYGFADLTLNALGVRGADPSRIAASVVSGIGFLGAGVIFVRSSSIKGLTTASGLWTTAGIGLALGSGLYLVGITATIFIVLLQVFLHKDFKILHVPVDKEFVFLAKDNDDAIKYIFDILAEYDFAINDMKFNKLDNDLLKLSVSTSTTRDVDMVQLMNCIYKNENIKSANF